MHIQISEIRVSPEEVAARRQRIAERLDNLNLINASQGTVSVPDEPELLGYRLSVGGVEIPVPVVGYEVVSGEDGPAVTVTIPATNVVINGAGMSVPAPTPEAPKRLGVWGQADIPDPRENIPGWQPEGLGQQVADNARANVITAATAHLRDSVRSSMVSLSKVVHP